MASYLELINPANGEKFRELPYHNWEEAKSLLIQADNTQKEWKQAEISERIQFVNTAMDYFRDNQKTIADDITRQMGKPISQSMNEVKGMIHRAEVCCDLAETALEDIHLPELTGIQRYIRREPLGVVLDIAAWNYPLLIAINVVIPAILAGNAVAIKHSSLTPLCGKAFEDAFAFANAPKGLVTALVLNHKVAEEIINSNLIDYLAFTGSISGGRKIQSTIKDHFIGTGFELGGKDPAYIREDADLDMTIPAVMDGVFYNGGQSCCSVERIYVHHSLFDTFLAGALQYMNALKIGNPMEESTYIGPMAQLTGVETAIDQVKDAKTKGADIHYYSENTPAGSHFLAPSILTNVNHEMDVMMEESFAPIVGIMPVQSDTEAIQLMNDSPYGLTASVWTKNIDKGLEIGDNIETGTFYMNRCDVLDPALPWVGLKDSGKGCTLSALGLQQLTRPKAFNLKVD